MKDKSIEVLSQITVFTKYAKFLPEKNRRETWEEIVDRNRDMHIKKYPQLAEEIAGVYENFVKTKKILPSMRSLQFGGKPIELSPNRVFNCAYLPVDDWRAFGEIMFLLLGGCFHEDTKVTTRDGAKRIKDVTIDDYVLTFNTERKTYHWIKPFAVLPTPTEEKEKYQLTFDDGSVIKATEDHPFYTKNRGWVKAKDLMESDDIVTFSTEEPSIVDVSEEEIRAEYPQFF